MINARVRTAVQAFVARFGYEIRNLPVLRMEGEVPHGEVAPWATYSPWHTDTDFIEAYETIKTNTLVDIYRCYELWQLIGQIGKLERGAILEVGVWRGGTTGLMAKRCKLAGITEPIYACDTFSGVVGAGNADTWYKGGEHADTSMPLVKALLEKLDVANVTLLQGIFPQQTGDAVADKEFRFCHVDVDVYQSAKEVVEWVWPRLIAGGIVVFDDYGFSVCEGITRLVNEYRRSTDRLVIHNLNGHAIMIKLPNTTTRVPHEK